ncbi:MULTISPECIES: ABC transporter ATP-binding protein [Diplocloster]|uniref:ABC transporter ATP-binding protein n=2 Tax=Diplocloster TaxID=2918511 RepID=A0A949JX38_9FIRM|nr:MULTISPECIES: ABC transporter ATP-binding protein [Lachnospiraceae]SCJ47126.1 Lipoprotein-releasing system ATP-binding protein LolD [uncultured Clostridium sp.]MBU9728119.1 ABC transporter ATP-binding protein [Diplocloster modestus]MBU9736775.1 ABC transporter ATP-binding protein [Diplocloster agilis]MBU9736836.1 ABC transporter ATP-binding protein [Diplocloster agilis]MBU9744859.1 ABC transporter ATP-binding protein [Diplocloster agilis]
MPETILRGEALSKTYGSAGVEVNALTEAAFDIAAGEFIVVLGPSGSGKSTLLNMLGGMDRPSAGHIWYRDRELTQLNDVQLSEYRKDTVGFVFQFFNLIPSLTARENVALAASIVSSPMNPDEALSMVGLKERSRHFPSQLSGGEQQRVSIARAIVKNPGLLLCDEPTGALDSKNSIAVVNLLLEVRKRLGCAVITITHNAGMAQVADRVFYMRDGRIERVEVNPAPVSAEEMTW